MASNDPSTSADSPLRKAVERHALSLARFAAAATGSREHAAELVADVLGAAKPEVSDDRAALGAALRVRCAEFVENRRRQGVTAAASDPPLRRWLAEIRPTERDALLLHHVAGLSVEEVARAASVDEATVQTRLSRGLVHLCRKGAGESSTDDAGSPERRAVLERLSEVLDSKAPAGIAEFASKDDACRDLVHDAGRLVADLRALDADLAPDLEAILARAVELARAGAAPAKPSEAVHDAAEEAEATRSGQASEPASEKSARGDAGADEAGKDAAPTKQEAARDGSPDVPLAERLGTKGRLAVALGAAAALGALVLGLSRSAGHSVDADAAWSGKIARISRAYGGGGGVERCSPDHAVCSPARAGDAVPAGSTLRTDGQTRAILELEDGTRVSLDRASELAFDGSSSRRARLDHGALVAEVPDLGSSRARFDVPLGFVEVVSSKLSIVAAADTVSVEVVRGSARLVDERERGVGIHAGEEGRLESDGPPVVSPTAFFGSTLKWSERAFAAEGESSIAGLGELRAKKPGVDQEQKGAVTLASHATRVRIVGSFARTEIEETFENSTSDVLEGIFRFPLPPDAQIERLALDVDGRLEDGAFVDRDRAAAIWRGAIVNAGDKKPVQEEIVWVPGPWRDPALLEWQRGGRFELRIYPIPKHGSRRVVLAYTQAIAPSGQERRYVYPLPVDPSGSTRVGRFDVDVEVRGQEPSAPVRVRGYDMVPEPLADGGKRLHLSAQGFVPSGDLSVEYALAGRDREVTAWAYQPGPDEVAPPPVPKTPGGTGLAALPPASTPAAADSGAPFVAIALRPRLPRTEEAAPRRFAVIVDSSRSMFGERYRRATDLATRFVRELDPKDPVTVLACDSTCRALDGRTAPGPEGARTVEAFLREITPEGGSDVAGAIRHARERLGSHGGEGRVVYIGDGTPTIGALLPAFVKKEVETAMPRDAGTVTTVAIGADADTGTLATIAEAGGGVLIPYTPGEGVSEAVYRILGATYGSSLADVRLELPEGVTDVTPRVVPTIPAGGEVIVAARLSRPLVEGTVVLRGAVGSVPFEQRYPVRFEATTAKGNAFVTRLWAAAKIGELEKDTDAVSRERAVSLSRTYRVASRYTSLLVLESTAMFRAFGLDQEQRAATWTGETDATSTESDGEIAMADADRDAPGNPYDERGSDKKAEAEGAGYASGSGRLGAAAEPMPAAKAKAPMPSRPRSLDLAADDFGVGGSTRGDLAPSPAPAPAAPAQETARSAPAPTTGIAGGGPLLMRPPPPPPARRWVPMRKIWERYGHVVTPADSPASASATAVAAAEAEVQSNDLKRDAVKRLFSLLLLRGSLDRAAEVAERWSTKDPLDPDALTARADVAAARGDRELAIRVLGSVVDVRPGDHKAQWRLARLHRWAGRAELGCRHSMAVAQIRRTDGKLLAEAVRCARNVGRADVATDLLALADDATRRGSDAVLAKPEADPNALSGDIRAEATWDGGDDLDLALVGAEGRVSWLGAPTRAVITARDVQSTGREGLALRGGAPGEYLVEVTRPAGHTGTVRGTVDVTAAGERRTVPFVLDGARARVALVRISTRSRLVPL